MRVFYEVVYWVTVGRFGASMRAVRKEFDDRDEAVAERHRVVGEHPDVEVHEVTRKKIEFND